MRLNLLKYFILASVITIFYLSWVPKPHMGLLWFMPDWLAQWADANENKSVRTGVPFVVLGALTAIWLFHSGYQWYWWLASWLILITIVLIAEVGQLFISARSFDWWDIMWGAIGAAVGIIVMIFVKYLRSLWASR